MTNGPHQHRCKKCDRLYDCPIVTHCHAGERYPALCDDCYDLQPEQCA